MSEIWVEGNVVVVGRTRVHLRFLDTFRGTGDGGTEARVRVLCRGCRRLKTVARVGLRHVGDGVIDLQPYCHECRGILNARRRGA